MKHVAVIGAGIIGASAAYFLARAGCRVTVLDAAEAGGVASRASFGWLNASFHLNEPHFRLRHAAMAAHRKLAEEVTGHHIWPGCLWFEEEGEPADIFCETLVGLGYAARVVAEAELRLRWPQLKRVSQAVLFPEEGAIDTPELAKALLKASGAEIRTGRTVTGLMERNGTVCGVNCSGEIVRSDEVVVAAGTGSAALLAELGFRLPMLRRPGAMVITRPARPLAHTLLCGPMGEVRQLADGRVLMPTSPNHQGDEAESLPESLEDLAKQALSRLGEVIVGTELQIETVLAAHRPVPEDGLPVLDRVLPGLTVAVMHSGATLAAFAGTAIADLVGLETVNDLWRPYGLGRFNQ